MKLTLLKASLSIALIGILLLLFLANTLEPKQINIEDIDDKSLNTKVQIKGEILSIRKYEKSDFQVMSVEDKTGKIEITTDKILNITKEQEIIVFGRVKQYQDSFQIQAEKIILPS